MGSCAIIIVMRKAHAETSKCNDVDFKRCRRLNGTDRAAVVPADIGWQDVGSWARLAEIVSKADNWASDDLVAEDAHDNYVWAPGKLVALIGVEGLVVVDTEGALLITTKQRSEDVKAIVERLKRDEREDLL